MKAIIYTRVSTRDKQDVNTQLNYLNDYAKRNDVEIGKIYSDIGESGSKESRPQFDLMLDELRHRSVKTLLVYKLDRIGRSLPHLVKLFEEFYKRGINFISATQNINTTTPEGRMFLNMLMVLAQYERELTLCRITAGLNRALKEGKKLGRPKGKKDIKPRRKSGYYQRWSKVK